MLPYSKFEIISVENINNNNIFIKLKEIHIPRSFKIILWIDDNP